MLELIQTLEKPVQGYWDGGPKQRFTWTIDGEYEDDKGKFVRIGSWEANHYFHVSKGRTDKLTLSYAKKHLKSSTRYSSTFEYREVN